MSLVRLIAKWKKQGYEKLCCVRCIQSRVSISICTEKSSSLEIYTGYELCRFDLYLSST